MCLSDASFLVKSTQHEFDLSTICQQSIAFLCSKILVRTYLLRTSLVTLFKRVALFFYIHKKLPTKMLIAKLLVK